MGTKKVKAIELIMDWNLWPRQSAQRLDSTNVARMREALRTGFPLPPIIINAKDYRIIDGFHRTRAVLDVFGDDADIEADVREFESDQEMYLTAGATNSMHGLPMSPKDRAHFILRCRSMKIPWPAVAEALGMDTTKLKDFIKARSAKTETGENIPLAAGARGLAGKTLTQSQEKYARTSNGCLPEMYISMLINALRADALELNEKTIGRLKELAEEIQTILDGVE